MTKRLISLMLALIMLLSLCLTSCATAPAEEEGGEEGEEEQVEQCDEEQTSDEQNDVYQWCLPCVVRIWFITWFVLGSFGGMFDHRGVSRRPIWFQANG